MHPSCPLRSWLQCLVSGEKTRSNTAAHPQALHGVQSAEPRERGPSRSWPPGSRSLASTSRCPHPTTGSSPAFPIFSPGVSGWFRLTVFIADSAACPNELFLPGTTYPCFSFFVPFQRPSSKCTRPSGHHKCPQWSVQETLLRPCTCYRNITAGKSQLLSICKSRFPNGFRHATACAINTRVIAYAQPSRTLK